ncbi:histone-like nucleoid-structuring protein, MvaT/MvaU family [Litchfieldella xinjiangensis]|uniref:histone-like nucleoid-structuring protein, MvaT/MvaU family n=1 Tax=Litchfieldella xinjiangensis TaxID=1166948 RepID=UPI0005B98DAB|nr:histone-like nucleoid-structuring protein, MvaT/MvaU family [Halomonas xinjiangensis]
MSSLLQQHDSLTKERERIQAKIERLENDDRLKREMEFNDRLAELMEEFDKTANDVLGLLKPNRSAANNAESASTGSRRKRKLKIYKNPKTGEVVETRGGNQKTLKAWKDEHGQETVESWLVREES